MSGGLAQRLVAVRPSPRQVSWQNNEFTAFLHFGMNTFTNREWGDGREDPALFAPTQLDTDQWCKALAVAGVTACILTAKHHDGFCLWHTATTAHGVAYTPFGRDVAAELAASCRRHGLKLGFYLSPWDRHEPRYGTGGAYNDFFCAQLTELLQNYGPLYCLWFDGACGEGANGKRQSYDWERYYALIRQYQPEAVISVCGPDIRWCGNEAGDTRPAEWSVVPAALRDVEKIQANSQRADDLRFRERGLKSSDADLGSREALRDVRDLCWFPAEVNVSIRPGWFYHPAEDGQVKSLDKLLDIYDKSVGGNAVLLLNVPPDTRGLIAPPDEARLRELGQALKARYAVNLAVDAKWSADAFEPVHPAENARRDDDCFWKPTDGTEAATLTITFSKAVKASLVVLAEQITESQRVERFELVGETPAGPVLLFSGTTIGHKRICHLPQTELTALSGVIQESRSAPTLRFAGVY